MRIDARNLLDRLGKNDFAYKEFEDRFSELELWPLLEALLRDPRLQALDQVDAVLAAASDVPAVSPVAESQGARSGDGLTSLFQRYGRAASAGSSEVPTMPGQQQDVRAMLRHLASLNSQGEL